MSKILSNAAIKAVNRIGDIIVPQNGEFPSYSEYGCSEKIDDIIQYAPKADLSDLNLLLSILSIMPDSILKWVVKKMTSSHHETGQFAILLRQIDFGLKGIILSTYYSDKAGSSYNGKGPLDILGYEVNRIKD